MKSVLLTHLLSFFVILSTAAQKHTITIGKNQRVASLEMISSEYSSLIKNDDLSNDTIREALVKDIYQKFDDKFDFIFFILNETIHPSSLPYAGKLFATSNANTGIGQPIFNFDTLFGSVGKLKSVMALTKKDYLLYGPSLHELMHNWENDAIPTKDWNGSTDYDAIPHWGFTGGNTRGQLGGFQQNTLKTNIGGNPNKYSVGSFGGFANSGNSVPYTDLELYLMGMIPITDVAKFDVFRGLTQAAVVDSTIEFTASTRVNYDSTKILADEGGPRNPSSSTSQKNFRLLVVVLTPTPLTSAEWATFDAQSEKFSRPSSDSTYLYNFWEATRGIGTIETGNLLNAVKSALPITLVKFEAQLAKQGVVNLSWLTASEINNDYFTIERSDNGFEWAKIKTIKSKNNSTTTDYHEEDKIPFGTFSYRLKQTDLDGHYTYSKIVSINNKEAINITVFPNPASKEIALFGDHLETLQFYLTDLIGHKINIKPIIQQNKATFNISTLSKGAYFIYYYSQTTSGYKKVIIN